MKIAKTIRRKWHTLTHTPRLLQKKFAASALFLLLPDKAAVKLLYRNVFQEELDLENPQTFNAKLQWLKLYDRRPEYTMMVDKYKVRDYIKSTVGEEYLIPLLGVWDRAEDIDFDTLPNQFVLKCNHGSGCNIICKDKTKLDRREAIRKLNRWMRTDYYRISREWPYKDVPRRIIAEKYMQDEPSVKQNAGLSDYKVLCFGGQAKLIEVHRDRYGKRHTQDFFDENLELTSIQNVGSDNSHLPIDNEEAVCKMMVLSQKLSEGMPQVRVDWYLSGGQIYFGELTFFDAGGFAPFCEGWDAHLGEWITLPTKHMNR